MTSQLPDVNDVITAASTAIDAVPTFSSRRLSSGDVIPVVAMVTTLPSALANVPSLRSPPPSETKRFQRNFPSEMLSGRASKRSVERLEAFSVDDGWAGLVV